MSNSQTPHRETIVGSSSNDTIVGTDGDDVITDRFGDDTIDGGDGDDVIIDEAGSNNILGGAGNDRITVSDRSTGRGSLIGEQIRHNVIDAGTGNDFVTLGRLQTGSLTLDLGDGDDVLVINEKMFEVDASITLGSGRDHVILDYFYAEPSLRLGPVLALSDFEAGDAGDILNIGDALFARFDGDEEKLGPGFDFINPFNNGVFVLVQDGADTLVQYDADGQDGILVGPETFIRLENVDATTLTASNFGGFDPEGGAPPVQVITGTQNADNLFAQAVTGEISGEGGDDIIRGGLGDDTIDGGAGNDQLVGGPGDDIVRGGDDDDVFYSRWGSDTLEGGDGNDSFLIERPRINVADEGRSEVVTVNGGAGNDDVVFEFASTRPSFQTFTNLQTTELIADLGDGDDTIRFSSDFSDTANTSAVVTLGEGRDEVFIEQTLDRVVTITDFEAGDAGDVLQLGEIVLSIESTGWDRLGNPFTTGHLFLRQVGNATHVISSFDGAGGSAEFQDVLAILENVEASTLTAANFNGFDPAGAASALLLTESTDGDDVIYDTYAGEVIDGGLGDDQIFVQLGGSDTVRGGEGNDDIIVSVGFSYEPYTFLIEAGAGDDLVEYSATENRGTHDITIDLGAGNDIVSLSGFYSSGLSLALGEGQDIVRLPGQYGAAPVTITDFETGADGDRLDWQSFVIQETYVAGPFNIQGRPNFNPFAQQYARLVQSGDDAILEIRRSTNSQDYKTVAIFENTNIEDLTTENIGYFTAVPTATGDEFANEIDGNAEVDVISGGAGDDIISGLENDDYLYGDDGNDTLIGGDGADTVIGGNGDDMIDAGDGDDYIIAGRGNDTIVAGAGNDFITGIGGNDIVDAGGDDDDLQIQIGFTNTETYAGSVLAGAGNDTVYVGGTAFLYAADPLYTVDLGSGDDLITLEGLIPFLTLGEGQDEVVVERSPFGGVMEITDFETGAGGDTIDLLGLISPFNPFEFNIRTAGVNPFEVGALELRQVGDDVQVFYVPDLSGDFPDEHYVTFQNTRVEDFTAENFGGYDPGARAVRPFLIEEDFTVDVGEAINIGNIAFRPGGAPLFRLEFTGAGEFINEGSLITFADADGLGVPVGIEIDGFNSSLIHNTRTGEIIVQQLDGLEGDFLFSAFPTAYGIQSDAQNLTFLNEGFFLVTATYGEAVGFEGAGLINNDGEFRVIANYGAVGFDLGNENQFDNNGTIVVEGGFFAIAVDWRGYTNQSSINNSGTIVALDDPNSPNSSIAFDLSEGNGSFVDPRVITNSGLISADIAIFIRDTTNPDAYPEQVINTGLIQGALFLGNGNDEVLNADGDIRGQIFLERGDDLYDGIGGLQAGGVYGGLGDDTYRIDTADIELIEGVGEGTDLVESLVSFTLGSNLENLTLLGEGDLDGTGNSGANVLIGTAGNNVLTGFAGNDRLDGRGGTDRLIGGLGRDYYIVDSADDVIVELEGEGIDTVETSSSFTLSANLENLRLTGDANLNGTGNSSNNDIFGNRGANRLIGGEGNDLLDGSDGADVLIGGAGDDTLVGGSNVDTVVLSGNFSDYSVFQLPEEAFGALGFTEVFGPEGSDFLVDVEFIQFDDQILRLRLGEGVEVEFETADPTVYQDAVTGLRDFDGNDLGGDGAWLRIGSADVNGDGDIDQILVNDAIGRFATVGTAPNGLVYFDDHGWAGETRVAGIYIDPFVANGTVEQGSEFDSQRRFQNDLQIENINRVLGANDYNSDGVWEVYFALTDGTAFLQASMHADGNIRFANYQSEEQVREYLTANGFGEETFGDWFTGSSPQQAEGGKAVAQTEGLAQIVAAGLAQPVDFTQAGPIGSNFEQHLLGMHSLSMEPRWVEFFG